MTKLTTSLILAVLGCADLVVSFHPQHPRSRHAASSGAFAPIIKAPTTSTELAGVKDFVGRFRRKKAVPKLDAPIKVGDTLPDVDVEIVTAMNEDGTMESTPVTISDLLGTGKNILVGMPGAFTTTCSNEHLPGYVSAASTFQKLGVDKIAVVTTNDRYVNSAWATDMGVLRKRKAGDEEPVKSEMITMLSDGDGELVRALGLAEDMGFGVGFRSKRFAMLLQDGKASYLVVDEGMDDCKSTAAPALVKFLTPESEAVSEELDLKSGGLIAAGGAVLLGLVLSLTGNDAAPAPKSVPPPRAAAIQRAAPKTKATPSESSKPSGFSLLESYGGK